VQLDGLSAAPMLGKDEKGTATPGKTARGRRLDRGQIPLHNALDSSPCESSPIYWTEAPRIPTSSGMSPVASSKPAGWARICRPHQPKSVVTCGNALLCSTYPITQAWLIRRRRAAVPRPIPKLLALLARTAEQSPWEGSAAARERFCAAPPPTMAKRERQ
jgi:hypothetical protein